MLFPSLVSDKLLIFITRLFYDELFGFFFLLLLFTLSS
jgi:hypothetical protein